MSSTCPHFRALRGPGLVLILLAAAAPTATAAPHPAVCRVSATSGSSVSYGSGSLIAVAGQRALVITNWHVVREATGQISVVFPNGFHSAAQILKVDRDWDLAALAIHRPDIAPIKLAQQSPKRGDPLTIAGYGSGQFRAITGRCTQYVSPGQHHPFHMVEVSVAARQGDSGGPILNQRGELAGVLFGAGRNTTTGSYVGRVRWFVDSLNVPLEDDRTMIAQQPAAPQSQPTRRGMIPPQHAVAPKRDDARPPVEVAKAAPTFRTPHVSTPTLPEATAKVETVTWTDIAGETLFQQIKSVLALVGLLSLLVMGLRRNNEPPENC